MLFSEEQKCFIANPGTNQTQFEVNSKCKQYLTIALSFLVLSNAVLFSQDIFLKDQDT